MRIKTPSAACSILALIMLACAAWHGSASAQDAPIYTWENCLDMAAARNRELLSSREKIKQSQAAKGISRSPMLPQVSASFSGKKTDSGTTAGSTDEYSYGLTAKQLVFDGFKSYYDLKGAGADVETALRDYSVISADVRLSLRKAFITLLKAQRMLTIEQDIEKRRKHILDLVKMKYEAGNEHRGSYFSSRADYLSAQASVKSAARDVSLAKKTLAYLMGLNEGSDFQIKGDLKLLVEYVQKPDFSGIVAENPTYLRSHSASKAAQYSLESSKMAFSPELYGTASAGKTGETLGDMTNNWSIGFQITAPLFSGGETWYGFKKAEAAYRQALHDEQNTRNTLMKELEENWNSLVTGIESVDVQKASLEAYTERSRIGEVQYSIGTLSFDNWTIIENSRANAEKSYIEACASALTAEAQWINASGGTLENESKK